MLSDYTKDRYTSPDSLNSRINSLIRSIYDMSSQRVCGNKREVSSVLMITSNLDPSQISDDPAALSRMVCLQTKPYLRTGDHMDTIPGMPSQRTFAAWRDMEKICSGLLPVFLQLGKINGEFDTELLDDTKAFLYNTFEGQLSNSRDVDSIATVLFFALHMLAAAMAPDELYDLVFRHTIYTMVPATQRSMTHNIVSELVIDFFSCKHLPALYNKELGLKVYQYPCAPRHGRLTLGTGNGVLRAEGSQDWHAFNLASILSFLSAYTKKTYCNERGFEKAVRLCLESLAKQDWWIGDASNHDMASFYPPQARGTCSVSDPMDPSVRHERPILEVGDAGPVPLVACPTLYLSDHFVKSVLGKTVVPTGNYKQITITKSTGDYCFYDAALTRTLCSFGTEEWIAAFRATEFEDWQTIAKNGCGLAKVCAKFCGTGLLDLSKLNPAAVSLFGSEAGIGSFGFTWATEPQVSYIPGMISDLVTNAPDGEEDELNGISSTHTCGESSVRDRPVNDTVVACGEQRDSARQADAPAHWTPEESRIGPTVDSAYIARCEQEAYCAFEEEEDDYVENEDEEEMERSMFLQHEAEESEEEEEVRGPGQRKKRKR